MTTLFQSDLFKFIWKTAIVVGAFWGILMGAKETYNFAYDNAYKAFEQQVNYLRLKIEDLEEKAALDSSKIDALTAQNTGLENAIRKLRTTKVILKDTLMYEGEAITLFGGKLSILCERVSVRQAEWGVDRSATIDIDVLGEKIEWHNFRPGDLEEFEYNNSKYILTILGIREYEKGIGIKIAVYKAK